jgi:hypothetical protein
MDDDCPHETTITYKRAEGKTIKACLDCGLIKVIVDGHVFETYHAVPIVCGVLRKRFVAIEKLFKFLGGGGT